MQLSVIGANQQPIYIDQFVDSGIVYEYCILAENDCGDSELICDLSTNPIFLGSPTRSQLSVNLDVFFQVLVHPWIFVFTRNVWYTP